jgi:hypothetical protein
MHTTEIIRQKQESDEAISVTIRCCGNPLTDSTLTIYGVHEQGGDQLAEHIEKHHDRVAAKCSGMGAGRLLLSSGSIKQTKQHGG